MPWLTEKDNQVSSGNCYVYQHIVWIYMDMLKADPLPYVEVLPAEYNQAVCITQAYKTT